MDGQADGIALAYTHYSIYAVARNKISFFFCLSVTSITDASVTRF